MTMNRLKFNEGGQPVYVDDLETLQENDTVSMKRREGVSVSRY